MHGVSGHEGLLGETTADIVNADDREITAHVVVAGDAELARLAVHERLDRNPLADPYVVNPVTDCRDGSGELVTKDDRRRVARHSVGLELVQVRPADAAPLHVDLHRARHDRGLRHVLDAKIAPPGVAASVVGERLHSILDSWEARIGPGLARLRGEPALRAEIDKTGRVPRIV